MIKILVFVSAIFISAVSLASDSTQTDSVKLISSSTVQAHATAEIMVEPDVANYSLTITTVAATAQQAAAQNAILALEVNDHFNESFGIQKKDKRNNITTQKYVEYENNKAVDKGYKTINTITYKIRQLDKLGKIFDDVSKFKYVESGYISYGLENSRPVRLQALTLASEQAQGNAEAMLKFYGKKVGKIIAIVQAGAEPIYKNEAPMAVRAASAPAGGGAPTSVSSGQITVSAGVTILYSIE